MGFDNNVLLNILKKIQNRCKRPDFHISVKKMDFIFTKVKNVILYIWKCICVKILGSQVGMRE